MVVPVFITSCQVSEYWNTGPVAAHTITVRTAIAKTAGFPAAVDIALAALLNAREIG